MIVLGIESSCDETAVAVVRDGREILSNKIRSQIDTHKIYGGVVPEIASRAHTECISELCSQALEEAKLTIDEIEAVAVTSRPGLIGALLIGVNFAKSLAFSKRLPLVAVNHLRGHIASNYLAYEKLKPPFLALIVSGGHTSVVKVKDYTDMEMLSTTRDDAAGECMDKVARVLGLSYPGGVALDKLSQDGVAGDYKFPMATVKNSPLDFSFSGVKTAAVNQIHNFNQKGESFNRENFAASIVDIVTESLISRLLTCVEREGINKVAICGGVSANSMLRRKAELASEQYGFELFIPPLSLSGNNAAMIASQGYYELLQGNIADIDLNAIATCGIN